MYRRITNIPPSPETLASKEVDALARVWNERKSEMHESGAYHEFLKRLQREWAIETGIIERLYTWDRGVTQALIEHGIEAAVIAHQGGVTRGEAEHIKDIIDDQLSIVEGLFGYVKGEQPFSEHFIRTLQAKFTAHQETTDAVTPDGKIIKVKLLSGAYKVLPNNPKRNGTIQEYCPPELVKEEMERLIAWYCEADTQAVTPEVLSAWLHHRFTQIHPFQDGNGRVARALASLVFLRAGLFPLVVRDADRTEYIDALEKADAGDLQPLVTLFSRRQRDAVLMALGLEQQTQQSKHAEQIISSAIQMLKDKFSAETKRREEVFVTAEKLRTTAVDRLTEIATLLLKEFAPINANSRRSYRSDVRSADNTSSDKEFFYHQIVDIAREFNYFANLERYRSWVRLAISTESRFEFVVSFHGYGHGDSGIIAASAFTALRVPREGGGGTEVVGTHQACTDLFQFNYAEAAGDSVKRFREWLEASIAIALAQWRRQISA
jgi:Fic family protein